jgi:hypothetical protein
MEKTNRVAPPPTLKILPLNAKDLYEIVLITDDKAGELKWLIPISENGVRDPVRAQKFKGFSRIQTPVGPQNLEFSIEAGTLSQALDLWPRLLEAAILDLQKQIEGAAARTLLAGVKPS